MWFIGKTTGNGKKSEGGAGQLKLGVGIWTGQPLDLFKSVNDNDSPLSPRGKKKGSLCG